MIAGVVTEVATHESQCASTDDRKTHRYIVIIIEVNPVDKIESEIECFIAQYST